MAKATGLSRQTIGFFYNGERLPNFENLSMICKTCNVSSDYLLGLSPTRTNNPDYQNACNLTGLKVHAIQCLQKEPVFWQIDKEIINEILCNVDFYKMAKAIYTAQLLNRNEVVEEKTFPQTVSVPFADPDLGGMNIELKSKDALLDSIKADATIAYHRILEQLTGKDD
jgi:transcriptional regulator with XRE-family HTH domain